MRRYFMKISVDALDDALLDGEVRAVHQGWVAGEVGGGMPFVRFKNPSRTLLPRKSAIGPDASASQTINSSITFRTWHSESIFKIRNTATLTLKYIAA